jgi:hypothetical protein
VNPPRRCKAINCSRYIFLFEKGQPEPCVSLVEAARTRFKRVFIGVDAGFREKDGCLIHSSDLGQFPQDCQQGVTYEEHDERLPLSQCGFLLWKIGKIIAPHSFTVCCLKSAILSKLIGNLLLCQHASSSHNRGLTCAAMFTASVSTPLLGVALVTPRKEPYRCQPRGQLCNSIDS